MREENIAGKPAPDSFLRGRAAARREAARGRRVRGRAVRCGRRVAPGTSAWSIGVDRVGQSEALAAQRRRRRGHRPRGAAASVMISDDAFPVEPWQVRETSLDLDSARAVRIGVRPVQRPHRAARQPRRGRTARVAWHVSQLVLRDSPAALRRGGVRLPGGRPDQSSTSPTARSCDCWSTTSRSTSATANCCRTNGFSTCARAR